VEGLRFRLAPVKKKPPMKQAGDIAFQSSRRLFFAHNQTLIFGKDLAKQGIRPPLDLDLRFSQARLLEFILVAKQTAKEILEVPGGLEKIPVFDIAGLIEGAKYTSEVLPVMIEDFFGYLISKPGHRLLPRSRFLRKLPQED
jgi:spore germination protein KC